MYQYKLSKCLILALTFSHGKLECVGSIVYNVFVCCSSLSTSTNKTNVVLVNTLVNTMDTYHLDNTAFQGLLCTKLLSLFLIIGVCRCLWDSYCLPVCLVSSWSARLVRLVLVPRVVIDLRIHQLLPSCSASLEVKMSPTRRTFAPKATITETSLWLSPVTTTLTNVSELNCMNIFKLYGTLYTNGNFFILPFCSSVLVGRATPKAKPPAQRTCSAAKKEKWENNSCQLVFSFSFTSNLWV